MRLALVVLLLLGTCAYASGTCDSSCRCSDASGFTWDLSDLNKEISGADSNYDYKMHLCGITDADACAGTNTAICQWNKANPSDSYKLGTFGGAQPSVSPIDVSDPGKGAKISYTNGDQCWVAGRMVDRKVNVHIECDKPATETFTVTEDSSTCTFDIFLPAKGKCGAAGDRIVPGQWYNGTIQPDQYHHFHIPVAAEYGELAVMMIGKAGDPDLYLRYNAEATKDTYDMADTGVAEDHVLRIRANEGVVRLQPGIYHIAAYAYGEEAATYSLRAVLNHCPGSCSGHGSCDKATKRCTCDAGYITDKQDCSARLVKGKIGESLEGTLPKLSVLYVEFDLAAEDAIELHARIQRTGGNAQVAAYLRRGAFPSAETADAFDYDIFGNKKELSVKLIQERIRGGKWYLAIDNEREVNEAFGYKISIAAHACPNGCSGHGTCNRVEHTCACDALWADSKDCSAATFPLTLGADTVTPLRGYEKTNLRVLIPSEAQQTGSALIVKVRSHGSPLVYPRIYLNPLTVPEEDSHWVANRLPQQTDTARLRVARDDIAEQGNKWYIQLDNGWEDPVNVTVTTTLQAYCAHGTSTATGTCNCASGWGGKSCEEDKSSHTSAGVVVFVAFLMLAIGFAAGFLVKRAFPHLCAKKETNDLQYNHLGTA